MALPVVELIVKPPGNAPVAIDQLYGAVPPDTLQVAEYGAPAVVGPPCGVQLSVRLGGAVTNNVVVTVGPCASPGMPTVTMQLCEPTVAALVFTETCTRPGVVPLAGVKPTQAQSEPRLVVNETGAVVLGLVTEKLFAAGAEPPTWYAPKSRVEGVTESVCGFTTSIDSDRVGPEVRSPVVKVNVQ